MNQATKPPMIMMLAPITYPQDSGPRPACTLF